MSTRLKALRTLVKVRERQHAALQRTADDARRQVARAQEQLADASAREDACIAEQAEGDAALDTLTRGAFTPDAMRALGFRCEDLKVAVAQARRVTADGRAAVEHQQLALASACAAVRRNERRIEGFRDQVRVLEREREAALEESAEEEAEEASTARFVARARRARLEHEAPQHG